MKINENCIECGKKVSWRVLSINIALFITEGVFAVVSRSRSLLADCLLGFPNILLTIITLISVRIADKKHNRRHPYGYGKIEYLSAGIVNILFVVGALAFIFISLKAMIYKGSEKPPDLIAVGGAFIALVSNQIAYLYGQCAGKKLNSPIILANATQNQNEVMSCSAVIIAVIGANLGIFFLDDVVAIIIGIIIIAQSWKGMKDASKGLMDYSSKSDVYRIKRMALNVNGVLDVGSLKVRHVGRKTWIDMEIFVSDTCSVGGGLGIIEKLKNLLNKKMKNMCEVSVQMRPENG